MLTIPYKLRDPQFVPGKGPVPTMMIKVMEGYLLAPEDPNGVFATVRKPTIGKVVSLAVNQ